MPNFAEQRFLIDGHVDELLLLLCVLDSALTAEIEVRMPVAKHVEDGGGAVTKCHAPWTVCPHSSRRFVNLLSVQYSLYHKM